MPEDYVIVNLSKNQRRHLAMLRSGTLPIHVETGRYTKPKTPIENRTCSCNHVSIEDEMHILLNCHLYDKQRRELFDKAMLMYSNFQNSNNITKYCLLLTSNLHRTFANTVINEKPQGATLTTQSKLSQ